jgi:hypothetical protein
MEEEPKFDLHNVPYQIIVMVVLAILVVVGASILTAMSGSTTGTGSSFSENKVLFTGGTATLANDYCNSVTSVNTFEFAWPLP